jgi:hypothetical protein
LIAQSLAEDRRTGFSVDEAIEMIEHWNDDP